MWVPQDEDPEGRTLWSTLYDFWDEIKLDIHEAFGVDLDVEEQRKKVSWHWLESRIGGLLDAPPVALTADGRPVPRNRLQWSLMKK